MTVLHRFGGMQVNGQNAMRELGYASFQRWHKGQDGWLHAGLGVTKAKKYKRTEFLLLKLGLVF